MTDKTILAKHPPYDDGHLGPVLDEMVLTGSPTIRCVRVGDKVWAALEGSHRLAAASILGLSPKIVVLQPELEAYDPGRESTVLRDLPAYRFSEVWVLDIERRDQ